MSSSSGSSYTSSPLLEPVPLPGPPAGGGVLHSRPNSSSPPSSNKRPRLGDRVRSRSSQSEGSDHEEEEHYQNGTHQPQQPLSHQPHPVLRPNDADVGAQEEVQWGLEPTFFGIEPLDEFTTKVGDWLWDHSKGRANVEIEAKIGTLRDPTTNRRVQLPVLTETILQPSADRYQRAGFSYVFDSDMSAAQHKHYNTLLNTQFTSSNTRPKHLPPLPDSSSLRPLPLPIPFPIKYAHLHEVDTFHAIDPHGSNPNRRARKRTDKKTGRIVDCVEKIRIGDLNVYCPGRAYDWRLSVSVEVPAEEPQTPPTNPRHKDRVTYTHQVVQVDLTQVADQKGQKRHELEVEVVNVPQLLEEAAANEQGQENTYGSLLYAKRACLYHEQTYQ